MSKFFLNVENVLVRRVGYIAVIFALPKLGRVTRVRAEKWLGSDPGSGWKFVPLPDRFVQNIDAMMDHHSDDCALGLVVVMQWLGNAKDASGMNRAAPKRKTGQNSQKNVILLACNFAKLLTNFLVSFTPRFCFKSVIVSNL